MLTQQSPVSVPTSDRLEWIQVLRCLASLCVFGHHIPHYMPSTYLLPNSLLPVLERGFLGVEIFFVVSGFVIGLLATHSVKQPSDAVFFLLKRLTRIFLGYWPALLVLVVSAWIVEAKLDSDKAVTSVFLLSGDSRRHWLPVAWSLAFEVYFYAFVTIAYVVSPERLRSRLVVLALVAVSVWNLTWLAVDRPLVLSNSQPGAFWASPYTINFLIGLLCARWKMQLEKWPRLLTGIGAVLICSGMYFGALMPWSIMLPTQRLMFYGAVGVGALFCAVGLESCRVRAPGYLIRLGDASFSLYLLHATLLWGLGNIIRYEYCGRIVNCDVVLCVGIIAIILISVAWFKFIEKPLYLSMNRYLQCRFSSQRDLTRRRHPGA
jgi:exopolysaccharide production protein ExoZ